MFDPKKEVPDFRLCKKLKELGYPQDSGGWYWVHYYDWDAFRLMYHENINYMNVIGIFKAPTVMEMDAILPADIPPKTLASYTLRWHKHKDRGQLLYKNWAFDEKLHIETDRMPNAYAKMVIWLIENGYIGFEEG